MFTKRIDFRRVPRRGKDQEKKNKAEYVPRGVGEKPRTHRHWYWTLWIHEIPADKQLFKEKDPINRPEGIIAPKR